MPRISSWPFRNPQCTQSNIKVLQTVAQSVTTRRSVIVHRKIRKINSEAWWKSAKGEHLTFNFTVFVIVASRLTCARIILSETAKMTLTFFSHMAAANWCKREYISLNVTTSTFAVGWFICSGPSAQREAIYLLLPCLRFAASRMQKSIKRRIRMNTRSHRKTENHIPDKCKWIRHTTAECSINRISKMTPRDTSVPWQRAKAKNFNGHILIFFFIFKRLFVPAHRQPPSTNRAS